jgi:hypothetical protein
MYREEKRKKIGVTFFFSLWHPKSGRALRQVREKFESTVLSSMSESETGHFDKLRMSMSLQFIGLDSIENDPDVP